MGFIVFNFDDLCFENVFVHLFCFRFLFFLEDGLAVVCFRHTLDRNRLRVKAF